VNTQDKKCPDCGGSMKSIKIIDKTTRGMGIRLHSDLEYTVQEAKRSVWTGLRPIEGKITAYMCNGCGQVLLYGQPREVKAP
jgi:predicted RNA-binding Zn-ribbon protein involved in translation (DUF1610 family)